MDLYRFFFKLSKNTQGIIRKKKQNEAQQQKEASQLNQSRKSYYDKQNEKAEQEMESMCFTMQFEILF